VNISLFAFDKVEVNDSTVAPLSFYQKASV
jgi:hypothetical protein